MSTENMLALALSQNDCLNSPFLIQIEKGSSYF